VLRDPGSLQRALLSPADVEVVVSSAYGARLCVELVTVGRCSGGPTAIVTDTALWEINSVALWEEEEDG